MNIHQLEVFYTVAKFESITQAALSLSISQPAVSSHIKKLEAYYSIQLFVKDGRGIKLTSTGTQLYKLIAPFFSSTLLSVEALLTDTQHLKVYGNYLMTQFVLPESLDNPSVRDSVGRIIIKSMSSYEAMDELMSTRCDLALVSSSEVLFLDESLIAIPLFDDTIVYIKNSEAPPKDITLITSKSKRDIKELVVDTFPEINLMASIDVETTQDVIANLQVNQNVASFISSKFLEYYDDTYSVQATSVFTKFYAIYRKNSPNREQIQRLIDIVKTSLNT